MATCTQDAPDRQIDTNIIGDLEHEASVQRRRAGVGGTNGGAIASAARQVLPRNDHLRPAALTRRVATLTRKVDRRAEREDARRTVSAPPAVSDVVDPIDARLTMSDADTRSRIAQTIARLAQLDAKHIDVNVDDHVVTLLGYVRCWSERQMVEQVAWAAPAVSAVHNHLAVPF